MLMVNMTHNYYKKYIFLHRVNSISGNESLCDRLGFEAGSCICFNGGRMNHSKLLSENGGLSKALVMSLTLMVAPENINTPMNYWECWSPLDMRRVYVRFIPLISALCESLTFHFWVSSFFFFFENLLQQRLIWTRGFWFGL